MSASFLFNEAQLENYPNSANGMTLYAPGEVIVKFIGTEADVIVPEGVKAIGDAAFSGCATIETAILPASLLWIGQGAFSKCPNLKRVEIKEGVEETHLNLFSDCPSLECVILPNSLKNLQRGTFANCTSLRSVNIPDPVSHLLLDPFSNCPSLEHIHCGAQYVPTAFKLQNYPALKRFTASDKNDKIKIVDNVIYSHDGKKLLLCRKDIEGCFVIPDGVETIESYAFAHCLKLTEVVFPSTLYEIKSSAFQGCAQLSKVCIPENVKSIEDNAFNRNKAVSGWMKVTDPSLKPFEKIQIDAEAGSSFAGSDLFDFLVPNDASPLVFTEYPIGIVQKDRKVRFLLGYCLNYDQYSEDYAKGYRKFAKTLRKKVLEEAEKQHLDKVKDFYVLLDSGEFDKKAKQNKKSADTTSKKSTVKTAQAADNIGLSITATEAKKTWRIDKLSFAGGFENNKYYRVETVELKEYKGDEETVTVPSLVGKKPVSSIGAYAFRGNKSLKHITIPNSVIQICDHAFDGCTNLESVIIESDKINIASGVFSDCISLSSFTCKANSVKLGIQPFNGCAGLMDDAGFIILNLQGEQVLCGCRTPIQNPIVVVPDGVTSIDGRVFSYGFRDGNRNTNAVKKLRKVVIPASVRTIAANTFSAENLQEVVLPEGLEELVSGTFFNCISLKELHLPGSIKKIDPYSVRSQGGSYINITLYAEEGSYVETFVQENEKLGYKFAVEGSQGLEHNQLVDFIVENGVLVRYVGDDDTVVIPDNVEEIGSFVFNEKSTIKSITIPSSVRKIGKYAMANCTSLKSIIIPESVIEIEECAFQFSGIEEVSIPASLEEISKSVFSYCNLKQIVIPGTVKRIGQGAFSGSWTLERVIIEAGVEEIGAEAFYCNNNLKEVCIANTVQMIGDKAFYSCGKLTSITIPDHIDGKERFIC